MPVYRLLGPKLHRTSAGEASERLALSHVGRDGELRTLLERAQNVTDRCVSGIRTASGNVVAITEDAGIGKSRMLAEFQRHLGAAVGWLEVGAQSHRSEFSHALFQDLIDALLGVSGTGDKDKMASLLETPVHECLGSRSRRLLPDLFSFCDLPLGRESGAQLAALSPEALRRRMWDAVHELIASSFHGPTVLVFEDLHWADPSSIALLREIVVRQSAHLMIVFTSRPDAKRSKGWLRELTDTGDSILHLERLEPHEVRGLIDAVLTTHDAQSNLPERLTEKADGNPFYLVSFLRSLVDDGDPARRRTRRGWLPRAPCHRTAVAGVGMGAVDTGADLEWTALPRGRRCRACPHDPRPRARHRAAGGALGGGRP